MHTFNDEIIKAGYRFLAHYNRGSVFVEGRNWRLEIPQKEIGQFVRIFPELDWENGEYLEAIVGKYVRVTVDNDKITQLRHIIKGLEYCPPSAR